MSFKLDLFSATILELSAAIINKQLTCVQLVSACLSQIDAHDQTGLNLNAILERSKTALSEAEALDQELKERGTSRGPLHGIPFVVKGDIAVKGFALTGGNLAFGTGPVDVESPVVTSLREAGAVVLGTANLADMGAWACAGALPWSSRGGLHLCPYNKEVSPCVSSAGPAIAVAAGMAIFSVGDQCAGSLTIPGGRQGLAHLKPATGTLSTAGCMALFEEMTGLGFYAKSAGDVEQAWKVFQADPKPVVAFPKPLNFGVPLTLFADHN